MILRMVTLIATLVTVNAMDAAEERGRQQAIYYRMLWRWEAQDTAERQSNEEAYADEEATGETTTYVATNGRRRLTTKTKDPLVNECIALTQNNITSFARRGDALMTRRDTDIFTMQEVRLGCNITGTGRRAIERASRAGWNLVMGKPMGTMKKRNGGKGKAKQWNRITETQVRQGGVATMARGGINAVSYTHLTLPTNREV